MAAHFKLMNDIDLKGIDFHIIGSETVPFTGVFDGNGRKISNFTYTSTEQDWVGLFGFIFGATLKDLGLIKPTVHAGTTFANGAGSLAGYLENGTISNCYAEGGSVWGDGWVGGLVGALVDATITDYQNLYSRNIYNVLDNFALINLGFPGQDSGSHQLARPARFYQNIKNVQLSIARPYRADTYILISAGFDGEYGTADDICNFEWKYIEFPSQN